MIASLRGRATTRLKGSIVIEVNGVGYLIHASATTLDALEVEPEGVHVLVETQVREDAITLFGFVDADEKAVFRMLLGVQGVGPKSALSVLSFMDASEVLSCIAVGDARSLGRADGLGARLSQRIVSELQDKAVKAGAAVAPAPGLARSGVDFRRETETALCALGWRMAEIAPIIAAIVARGPPTSTQSMLKDALVMMGSR